ncbi:MAG: efflux RND transporter periplasmic adaptor subunit [Desulfobaccales bacterium]
MRHIGKIFLFIAMLGSCLSLALDGAIPPAQAAQLNFTGKLVCYLKRPVLLPVAGDIISLKVQPGQRVKEGEILGRYRLLPESVQAMRRRLLPSQITDLKARLAEIDKGLTTLKNKQNTLTELSRQNLAAPQSLTQIDQEIEALRKQRSILQEALEQAERTTREEESLARKQLGVSFKSGQVPKEAVLVAPIDGHVLWMHPDLRQGAQLTGGTPVIMVGVMDPMLLRAQVHEIEALKLQVGDKADITIESLPGQKFKAQVSRLPWAPPVITLEHPTYFDVEFKVENPDLILKEGLKATIEVRQPEDKNLSGISQEKEGGSTQGAQGKP